MSVPTEQDTLKLVTTHVVVILWTVVLALTAIGAVCIFKPPQEWTLLSTVVGVLKDLAFMIAGGWLALLHPTQTIYTRREEPMGQEPLPAPFAKFRP